MIEFACGQYMHLSLGSLMSLSLSVYAALILCNYCSVYLLLLLILPHNDLILKVALFLNLLI